MVSVANQEIHDWGSGGLEEGINGTGTGSRINHRQDSSEQRTSIPSRRQPADSVEHTVTGSASPPVESKSVMHLRGAVDADRDPDIELDENVDDLIGQEHTVRLNVNPAGCWERGAKPAAKVPQTIGPDQQRLSAMQHDTERSPLIDIKVRQLSDGCQLNLIRHAFRLSTPTVILHVIDIAVAAIEVAPTRYFEKHRVDHG